MPHRFLFAWQPVSQGRLNAVVETTKSPYPISNHATRGESNHERGTIHPRPKGRDLLYPFTPRDHSKRRQGSRESV